MNIPINLSKHTPYLSELLRILYGPGMPTSPSCMYTTVSTAARLLNVAPRTIRVALDRFWVSWKSTPDQKQLYRYITRAFRQHYKK